MKRATYAAVMLGVSALVAAALSAWTDLRFIPAFAIVVVAVLVNGLLATVEDDLPGGFNNPDGSATPPYVAVVRSTFAVLSLACAGVAVWMAVISQDPPMRWIAAGGAALGVAGACVMWQKRPVAFAAAAIGVAALVAGAMLR